MITRREFLKVAVGAGIGLAVPWEVLAQKVFAQTPLDPANLTKFIDPLPILPVMNPGGAKGANPFYDVPMVQIKQKLHSQLQPTTLWGYRGRFPGPTFEVRRDQPIDVRWMNNLPTSHFLPIDPDIHGAESGTPEVRTVVHLHGAKVLPESDGNPDAWFTPRNQQTGPFYTTDVYHYPNDQLATTLWYHDHGLGITRLNLYTGLEGFYIIRDPEQDALNLPKGKYEIPLMIQDRMFNDDGSLLYPVAVDGTHPFWIPEFFGDTVLVNGMVWPYLEVEPRKYRFRVLNASNARFYRLTLVESDAEGTPNGNAGPEYSMIGSDGGLLPAPVTLSEITIAPSERYDLVIDFSGREGKIFTLKNDAPAPFPDGDDVIPPDVMQFRVTKKLIGKDTSSLPDSLVDVPLHDPASAVKTRDLTLSELDRESDGFPIIALLNGSRWDDPVTENPKAGSTEIWRIFNTTGDAHPIHIHLVQFQILDRQPFDEEQFPGQLIFTGPAETPGPAERPAWKDTAINLPGTVTRVIAKFDLPTGTPVTSNQTFRYLWHCHILEHEDNEMMRPYDVVG